MYDYDWLVIGSGPAGEKGAVQAAYFGRRVAVVEKQPQVGGACINTGTIPRKAVRETVLHLIGQRQRRHYGRGHAVAPYVTMEDLTYRCQDIIRTEREVMLFTASTSTCDVPVRST